MIVYLHNPKRMFHVKRARDAQEASLDAFFDEAEGIPKAHLELHRVGRTSI